MSLQYRFLSLFLLIALVPLIFAGLFSYQKVKEALIKETINKLVAVADVQEKRVNEALDRYLDYAKLIASRTQLRSSFKEYEETKNPEAIVKIITEAKNAVPAIRMINIADEHEMTVASTDKTRIDKPLNSFWWEEHPKPAVSYHLHEVFKDDSNVLYVRLHGPLNLEGERIGLLEIEFSADLFMEVTEDYTGLGKTGEVVLAKKNQAGDALFLTPLRFDSGAALSRGMSQEKSSNPIISALTKKEEVLTSGNIVDYRDELVFSVTRFIDSLEWGLVVKIDQAEALAPIKNLLGIYASILFLTIIFVNIAALS